MIRITAFLAILLLGVPAFAQSRHALVVGIDSYDHVPDLMKAVNDARAVATAFEAAGFETELLIDPDEHSLLTQLTRFASRLRPGDEAAFFFAGHGVEIDSRNYLLPADVPNVPPGQEFIVIRRSLPVDDVIDAMQRRGARLSLLILDACRNNPFEQIGTRTAGSPRGLGQTRAPEGSYIMYSAGAGQAALDRLSDDDPNPNSVFTRALLPRLSEPGLPLRRMVREVRSEVRRKAETIGFNQFPAVYDQLDGEFTLIPAATEPTPPAPAHDPCELARMDWALLGDTAGVATLTTFLDQHGQCALLAAFAQERLDALQTLPEPLPEPEPEPVPLPMTEMTRTLLAAGMSTTCSILPTGRVACWGSTFHSIMDTSDPNYRTTPAIVEGLEARAISVAVGSDKSCALTEHGAVWCWDNESLSSLEPIEGLNLPVQAIAYGGLHACAIDSDGGLMCWGFNMDGRIGDGTTNSADMPVGVHGLNRDIVDIALGSDFSCATTSAGAVKCWGDNGWNQLAGGPDLDQSLTPIPVAGLESGVRALSAGSRHSCALQDTGEVYCWGTGATGPAGGGTAPGIVQVPGSGDRFVQLAAGRAFTCGLTESSAVHCWGQSFEHNMRTYRPGPVTGFENGVRSIAAGSDHLCALMEDDRVQCIGDNRNATLGDGTTTDRQRPVTALLPEAPPR